MLPISITELSKLVKTSLESQFYDLNIIGEITNLHIHSSGHIYMSLKDKGAVIDAVIWRGTKIDALPKQGIEVICYGYISSYSKSSKYQFIIKRMEIFGKGALQKIIEEIRNKLAKEGLFDPQRKKVLPKYPNTIAIITSKTGAVIHDLLYLISKRFPLRVILKPTIMQGMKSEEDIISSIEAVNNVKEGIDIIIIARGGGSQEDLMPFNSEKVVRKIASSSIPVISAIGHETDRTLSDYVADVYAATPTAAAEIAVPDRKALINVMQKQKENLDITVYNNIKNYISRCENIRQSISYSYIIKEEKFIKAKEVLSNIYLSIKHKVSSNHSNIFNDIKEVKYKVNFKMDMLSKLSKPNTEKLELLLPLYKKYIGNIYKNIYKTIDLHIYYKSLIVKSYKSSLKNESNNID